MTLNAVVSAQVMEGRGAYNRNSRVQAAGVVPVLPLLAEASRRVALAEVPAPVVIADYGCSQGHNSLLPLRTAIGVLRERIGRDRAVSVVHTDLPENDYTALFRTLAEDPESYLRDDRRVFPSAIGRSFYQALLPPGSVTLGWSSWSVQWLSRVPAPIPDQVQVAFSEDVAARRAFAEQAAADWRAFLLARGEELRTGGRLVVLTMASDDAGGFGYRSVVRAIQDGLLDVAASGLISVADVRRMVIPTYGRTRAEFLAPFEGVGRFAGLSVESVEVFAAEDRIWKETGAGEDATAFGSRWAAFSRASVFPTLAAGLDGGMGDPRAAAFMDALEGAMARRLAAAPEESLLPLGILVMVKGG